MALGKKRNAPHQERKEIKPAKRRKSLKATESEAQKRPGSPTALDVHEWYSESFKIDMQGRNERTTFSVHVGVAHTRSPLFAHALTSKPVNAALRHHMEPIKAEPQIFKLFLSWLYRGSFIYREGDVDHIMAGSPALLDADNKPCIYAPLIRLWLLAEVLEVPALANQTIDKMSQLADAGTLPSKGVIKIVYYANQPCQALRALMVQLCACYCKPEQCFTDIHPDFEKSLMQRLQAMVSSDRKRDSFKKRTVSFHLPDKPTTAWPSRAPKPEDIIDLVGDSEDELFVRDSERPPALDPEASSKHIRLSTLYTQPSKCPGRAILAPLYSTQSPASATMPASAKSPTAARKIHVQPAESDIDAANRDSELDRPKVLLEGTKRERDNAKPIQPKIRLDRIIKYLREEVEM